MKPYGQLNSAYPNDRSGKRRKVCLFGVPIALVLVVVIVVVSVVATRSKGHDDQVPVGSKAISSICSGSLYPDQCSTTLSSAPNASTSNPKELAVYLIQAVEAAVNQSLSDAYALNATNPALSGALSVCFETLDRALNQLNQSVEQLTSLSLLAVEDQLDDVHAWLDASATFHDTCLEEIIAAVNPGYFGNTTEIANPPTDPVSQNGESLKQLYSILIHLASYITKYASSLPALPAELPSFHLRKLLSADEESSQGAWYDFQESTSGDNSWVSRHGIARRLLQVTTKAPDAVVAADGSGKYKKIQDAVDAAPEDSDKLWVIYIKAGTYTEQVVLGKSKKNIGFRGDGIDKTIITERQSVEGTGTTTFKSATLAVNGNGFVGTGFTVRNTAGPAAHQAVALRVSADLSAFYQIKATAYQDTFYCHSLRNFYSNIIIEGTVDFIFGNAAAIIQSSTILAGTGLLGQQNTFTAQGRADPDMNTGIVIQNCKLQPNADYQKKLSSYKSYLGRPWKEYARTVYVDTYLDSIIDPTGWLPWSGTVNLKTSYNAEFKSKGPGAGNSKRVSWSVQIKDKTVVAPFLANKFVSAKKWLSATAFPYYATTYPS